MAMQVWAIVDVAWASLILIHYFAIVSSQGGMEKNAPLFVGRRQRVIQMASVTLTELVNVKLVGKGLLVMKQSLT